MILEERVTTLTAAMKEKDKEIAGLKDENLNLYEASRNTIDEKNTEIERLRAALRGFIAAMISTTPYLLEHAYRKAVEALGEKEKIDYNIKD